MKAKNEVNKNSIDQSSFSGEIKFTKESDVKKFIEIPNQIKKLKKDITTLLIISTKMTERIENLEKELVVRS